MESAPVLVAGAWRESEGSAIFRSVDPATTELVAKYPVSPWPEVERALAAGADANSALSDAHHGFLGVFRGAD